MGGWGRGGNASLRQQDPNWKATRTKSLHTIAFGLEVEWYSCAIRTTSCTTFFRNSNTCSKASREKRDARLVPSFTTTDTPGGARGSGNTPTPFAQVRPLEILRGNLDSVPPWDEARGRPCFYTASLARRRASPVDAIALEALSRIARAPVCSAHPPTHRHMTSPLPGKRLSRCHR